MLGRVNVAAKLLRDEDYTLAKQMLQKDTNDLEALYLLSLLCRYDDEYEQEKILIDKVLEINDGNHYMRDRLEWHEAPMFDRLAPRQTLRLPRDPRKIPTQETLGKMCFVTAGGSDSPYWECLVQLLESIRATAVYKNVPVMIIDCDMEDDDKDLVTNRFGPVTFVDPGWDVDYPKESNNYRSGLKGCSARPFIPKHFPGYQYYCWLDTDSWIQDERCLDLMLDQAMRQGISAIHTFAGGPDFGFAESWWDHQTQNEHWLTPEQRAFLLDKPLISGGAFIIDLASGLFEQWQEAFLLAFAHSQKVYGPDEASFLYAMHKARPKLEYLDFDNVYTMNFAGPPLMNPNGILCGPHSANPIGIFHLCGMKKDLFFHNMIESNTPTDIQTNRFGNVDRKAHSIHYRTWPWEDKPQIWAIIMAEVSRHLSS